MKEARDKLARETGNKNVELHLCDIASLTQVNKLVADYHSAGHPLSILVNNAGCMVHKYTESPEGVEYNFAANTLGTFSLTEGLLPVMKRNKEAETKVITVSSAGMLTQPLQVRPQLSSQGFFV